VGGGASVCGVTAIRKGSLDGPGAAALIDLLTTPSPASHVRLVLKVYRDHHPKLGPDVYRTRFEEAWAMAMRMLPRGLPGVDEWRATLHDHKDDFRRAYGSPTEPLTDLDALDDSIVELMLQGA
jgi:hypothetical protein